MVWVPENQTLSFVSFFFSQFQSLNFLLKLKLRKIVAKCSDIITVSGKMNVTESENI